MEKAGLNRIGVDHYISEEFYQKELDTIWKKCWLFAGRADDVKNPGDFFVFRLPFLKNTSIIVVRGKDGKLRGYYNACTHRGGKLAYYDTGKCSGALTCTFHGWVFNLEGKLVDIPFRETFGGGLDPERLALKAVSVDVWGGWVFVNIDPSPRWTLAEYLAPIPAALGDYFANEPWKWADGRKGVFRCNWKLQIDSQAEGHHAPFLHGRSIIGAFDARDVPAWAFPGSPGVPYKIEVHRPNVESGSGVFTSAVAAKVGTYRTAMYYNTDSDSFRSGTEATKYPGALNQSGAERWSFDLYQIFPNTVMMVQNGYVLLMRSWPRGVGKTVWEYDEYFTKQPNNFGEMFARFHGLNEMRNTITEDMTTVEGLFDNYSSGAVGELVIGEAELGVAAFERHVIEMVDQLSK
jgi:phenylpropionate dioxygenase-like ring-hydroxylating dioxygenase large terminal subunit